jgi:hypothetical protein
VAEPADPSGRESPGPLPGASVGVAAGLLLAAVWAFGAWDVALALTAVFVGLAVTVVLGAPTWRRFGIAMTVAAAVVGGVLVLLLV